MSALSWWGGVLAFGLVLSVAGSVVLRWTQTAWWWTIPATVLASPVSIGVAVGASLLWPVGWSAPLASVASYLLTYVAVLIALPTLFYGRRGPGVAESHAGQLLTLLLVGGLFVAPLWVMITAGLLQVFPDAMGMDVVVEPTGPRRVLTLPNATFAGAVSASIVAAFLAVVTGFGGTGWVLGRVQSAMERSSARRYQELAGDAVMAGRIQTRTRQARDDGSVDGSTETGEASGRSAPKEPSSV